jgi:hypothetical protein
LVTQPGGKTEACSSGSTNMAAAERKRADAIKGLEQFETVVRHGGDQQRQSEQDRKEHRQQDGIGGPADL